MTDDTNRTNDRSRERSVPSGRVSRFASFGRLASGVAGGMVAEGARRLAKGEGISARDLVLTPGNVQRMTDRLSHLRGAAMKMGQMISMDSGDFLPKELADILATLRDQANFMPAKQLDTVLRAEWGPDWRKQFKWFNPRPIAAASIGQVHKALTRDGQELAIKVQYPGIAESIDSDVDNVMTLLKVAGFAPPELEIDALLAEAKKQLHEEADYRREGAQMEMYREKLKDIPGFVVPTLHKELTRDRILAMSFEPGVSIEELENEPDERRDEAMEQLMRLVARELFDFGVMQTDPNFANFRYRRETGEIVLLDFGACRDVDPDVSNGYRKMLIAGLKGNAEEVLNATIESGFMMPIVAEKYPERVNRMIEIVINEMREDKPFDFGDRAFIPLLRDEGMAIAQDKDTWAFPPIETLFVQRKVSGTALLGARLKAQVNVRRMTEEVLGSTKPLPAKAA
ncbi:ABC1 kinase family protein [Erythrobacter crassostreae]|uniref:AarF/ABC1/UbiB kinase family protein n=1 Tax=Erythrobacter crassostreae TaxID=2828328 RepID=A0A9X1F6P1_9SPHN|nr:AarF/ABC1/UbiB kinase family protein [Erythrobacter crassostrea]MBV7259805.1 AarF/ABC1/UbiB kinase family protein [Erythrobacter crassostrea]